MTIKRDSLQSIPAIIHPKGRHAITFQFNCDVDITSFDADNLHLDLIGLRTGNIEHLVFIFDSDGIPLKYVCKKTVILPILKQGSYFMLYLVNTTSVKQQVIVTINYSYEIKNES